MIEDSINKQSKYFLIFLIGVFGYFMYVVYSGFLFTIMISALLIIGTLKLHNKIKEYIASNALSSVVLTLILAVFFFFPLLYFIKQLAVGIASIHIETLTSILGTVNVLISDIATRLDIQDVDIKEYTSFINPSEIIKYILSLSQTLAKVGVNFVADVSIVLVLYFILLIYKNSIGFYICNIIPLSRKNQRKILEVLSSTMSIVYSATLLTALLEGILFAIVVMFYGYDGFLFGMLYGFASLIPVVGGILLWIPVALYELSLGHTMSAMVISIYSIVIISIIADTFLKPLIITKIKHNTNYDIDYNIHEYVIFFAILAGMTSFGFWGIIIGPAVTTIFLTLLYIYSADIGNKKGSL